jgi:hypothetical protein
MSIVFGIYIINYNYFVLPLSTWFDFICTHIRHWRKNASTFHCVFDRRGGRLSENRKNKFVHFLQQRRIAFAAFCWKAGNNILWILTLILKTRSAIRNGWNNCREFSVWNVLGYKTQCSHLLTGKPRLTTLQTSNDTIPSGSKFGITLCHRICIFPGNTTHLILVIPSWIFWNCRGNPHLNTNLTDCPV